MQRVVLTISLALALGACATAPYESAVPVRPSAPGAAPAEAGVSQSPASPNPASPAPVPEPVPAPRSHRLGAATSALVTQARSASAQGDFDAAAATLERALRIEPDNPLVWIEMGRMRLASGDAAQAQYMGRRALALAAGAPREQSASWRLIAEALRARGRNAEAQEAARRADELAVP